MFWTSTMSSSGYWVCLGLSLVALVELVLLWRRESNHALRQQREQALRGELEAYARLDTTMAADADPRGLAVRVCRAVSKKSLFPRAALLLEDAEQRLYVAGSAGFDDLTIAALNEWGAAMPEESRRQESGGELSFALTLRKGEGFFPETGKYGRKTVVVPVRTQSGRMAGALAVGANQVAKRDETGIEGSLKALEALAARLGYSLEGRQATERMLRKEKMAGLGQLAGGVAHELNNPLTAVLGYAELIAEIAHEPRVREDAQTIAREALRMRETVASLLEFWRPPAQAEEAVQMEDVVGGLAASCRDELAKRGIRLVVQAEDQLPPVRGDRARLRMVLKHLLNNAAQSIAAQRLAARSDVGGAVDGEQPTIRMAMNFDGRTLKVVVSDTGTGFVEPARAFDPFYTTRQPGDGAGMGLSLSYGIVREHGGEIAVHNVHPHGAAVVVELPVRKVMAGESGSRMAVRA